MDDTIWRTKTVGDAMLDELLPVPELAPAGRGGALLINPGGLPDWLRDPSGNKVPVLEAQPVGDNWLCGKCKVVVPSETIVFVAEVYQDKKRFWFVYQCKTCGFVWEQYSKPIETKE